MNVDLSWLREQALIAVEADPNSWVFRFSGGGVLRAECPWRIVAAGGIALGSLDHQQKFGLPEPVDAAQKALSLLSARQVIDAHIQPETCDLAVEFSAEARLELFNDSSGYEGWALSTAGGRQFIAQGGGRLEIA